MSFYAYTMICTKEITDVPSLSCSLIQEVDYLEYTKLYNEAFYAMREALNIHPYDYLQDNSYIRKNRHRIYVLKENDQIIGAVTLKDNELDDLIVRHDKQGQGYGTKLLLWGMHKIREQYRSVTLHAADWNAHAVELYVRHGFVITEKTFIA